MRKQVRIICRFLRQAMSEWLPIREKPLVIQMPITSRCNSRCVTCNVWKHHERIDIDDTALKECLKDPFFSEVKSVGLNGGEFSLVPRFKEILDALDSLPKLKYVYLISNGLAGQRIKEYTQYAKDYLSAKGIRVSLCISIDGIGAVHDKIRGIEGNFTRSKHLIEDILKDSDKYCDQLTIGHTLSRFNIARVYELDAIESLFNIPIDIHLAVPNKRIGTFTDADRYDVLTDEETRQLAAEFFFSRFLEAESYHLKARYYANYYFLIHNGKGRLSNCFYRFRDITIDENLNMSLCATASESLGNLKGESASFLAKSKRAKSEVRRLKKECCDRCIHYTFYPLTVRGRFLFAREVVKQQNSMQTYKTFCQKRTPITSLLATLKKIVKIAVKYDY